VLVDEEGEIICKAYQLSKGNPIQDTKELLTSIRRYVAIRARPSR
jgi:activator of 2-hydroxyglutaryl-CoA dehydratase